MILRVFFLLLIIPSLSAAEELIAVTPHWEGVRREFEVGFNRWRAKRGGGNVTFRWVDLGGTSDIHRYLRGKLKEDPSSVGIDVLFGGGVEPYIDLAELDAFEPTHPEGSEEIPLDIAGSPLRDRKGRWYSVTMNGFGILYNKEVLKRLGFAEPLEWDDLVTADLVSWVGAADPRKSGSAHMAYEMILQGYGWEEGWNILYNLAGNVRTFSAASTQTPQQIAVGEVAYGLVIDSYAGDAIRKAGGDRLGYVIPSKHSAFVGDGIAVLRGAPHPDLAREFVEYSISPEAQRLFLLRRGAPDGPVGFELGRLSVRPDLYTPNALADPFRLDFMDPFEMARTQFRYDTVKGGKRWTLLNDLLGVFLIDAHRDLSALKRKEGELRLPMPITEEEATTLSERWGDSELRSRTIAEWESRAQQLYGVPSLGRRLAISALPALVVLALGLAFSLRQAGKRNLSGSKR